MELWRIDPNTTDIPQVLAIGFPIAQCLSFLQISSAKSTVFSKVFIRHPAAFIRKLIDVLAC
jgi:hypothetical protein